MKTKLLISAGIAAAALATGVAPAAAAAAPAPHAVSAQATPTEARALDAAWLKAVAGSDLFEIAAGRLAVKNAETTGVAALGALLVKDHTSHLAMVRKLAAARDVALPTAPPPADAAALEKLSGQSGITFDRNWTRKQVSAHRKAIILTGKERQTSRDSEVLALARMTLPVVTMHRDVALGIWIIIAPPETTGVTGS